MGDRHRSFRAGGPGHFRPAVQGITHDRLRRRRGLRVVPVARLPAPCCAGGFGERVRGRRPPAETGHLSSGRARPYPAAALATGHGFCSAANEKHQLLRGRGERHGRQQQCGRSTSSAAARWSSAVVHAGVNSTGRRDLLHQRGRISGRAAGRHDDRHADHRQQRTNASAGDAGETVASGGVAFGHDSLEHPRFLQVPIRAGNRVQHGDPQTRAGTNSGNLQTAEWAISAGGVAISTTISQQAAGRGAVRGGHCQRDPRILGRWHVWRVFPGGTTIGDIVIGSGAATRAFEEPCRSAASPRARCCPIPGVLNVLSGRPCRGHDRAQPPTFGSPGQQRPPSRCLRAVVVSGGRAELRAAGWSSAAGVDSGHRDLEAAASEYVFSVGVASGAVVMNGRHAERWRSAPW